MEPGDSGSEEFNKSISLASQQQQHRNQSLKLEDLCHLVKEQAFEKLDSPILVQVLI